MNKAIHMKGACRCGRVQMEITAPPVLTFLCHCTGCQKMSSSAFSLTAKIPADSFAVTNGDPVIGGMHANPKHYYCPHCKSCLYSTLKGQGSTVNVRMTLFDDLKSFRPFIELHLSEKLPWVQPSAPRTYDKAPTVADLAGLLKDYAEWQKQTA